MRRSFARLFYTVCKALGLFALARNRHRGHLRILCYHGFTLQDEERFRPSLFMSPDVLASRMSYLARKGFRVIPLDQAAWELRNSVLKPDSVAITIDDGFHSTHAAALPILARHGFPATLYLTSHYFEKGTPIFQLAIDYIFWKSPLDNVDLSGIGVPELDRMGTVRMNPATRQRASNATFEHGSNALDHEGRERLAERLGERLEIDYARLRDSRILSLVSRDELIELERSGVAIELHTHRHRFPVEVDRAVEEIEANRAAIEPVIGRAMTHFCYPSGFANDAHRPALHRAGIVTAATCQPGIVRPGCDPLMLPRLLDDSRLAMIEFEAEMSGFAEAVRDLRRIFRAKAKTIAVTGGLLFGAAVAELAT